MTSARADRFADRVADYVRHRPDYPAAALDSIVTAVGLGPGVTVADVGAGTGILTKPLAETGADVIAIDPSLDMLAAARDHLAGLANVRVLVGSAEATGLTDRSVDAITVGQAFHWFDHARAREEFLRVLRPDGHVVLIWNSKPFGESPFLAEYERLLEARVPEFSEVRVEKTSGDADITAFFGATPSRATFPHEQRLDWDGVLGRVMSSSYAPNPGHAVHEEFVADLRALFDQHARDGILVWPYSTVLYVGRMR